MPLDKNIDNLCVSNHELIYMYYNVFVASMVFILWSYGKDAASLLPLASGMYCTAKIIGPYLTGPFITNVNMESEKVTYFYYFFTYAAF